MPGAERGQGGQPDLCQVRGGWQGGGLLPARQPQTLMGFQLHLLTRCDAAPWVQSRKACLPDLGTTLKESNPLHNACLILQIQGVFTVPHLLPDFLLGGHLSAAAPASTNSPCLLPRSQLKEAESRNLELEAQIKRLEEQIEGMKPTTGEEGKSPPLPSALYSTGVSFGPPQFPSSCIHPFPVWKKSCQQILSVVTPSARSCMWILSGPLRV